MPSGQDKGDDMESPAALTGMDIARACVVLIKAGRWVELPQPESTSIEILSSDGTEGYLLEGAGLGFVLNPQGWIVTCAHVVELYRPREIFVHGRGTISVPIQVKSVHRHLKTDLAVIEPVQPTPHPPIIRVATGVPDVGMECYFWWPRISASEDSQAMNIEACMRRGLIAAHSFNFHKDPDTGEARPEKMPARLLVDATVAGGASGSPLVSRDGSLIGMVVAEQMRPSREIVSIPSGIGIALPAAVILQSISALAEKLKVDIPVGWRHS